jgi:hypothetical protein
MPHSEPTAPRFARAWAALVYALATLMLAYPALGGAFLVGTHSDQYIAGYAFREFAAEALKAGQGFPQWNPYLYGGMPYIAAMHGDIFYPTFLLRMLFPADVGMTWGFIIHLFLAGFFTYSFLRAWGLGFFPALIGGLAYMLSGPIAGLASPGHDGKLFVSALLPLSLWMIVRLIRDGRPWAWGTFAVVIGLAFLTPHPQLFQYFLLASGAFALYVALRSSRAGASLSRPAAFTRLGASLGAVVLGVIMGAVQYMPALFEYEKWSPRAGGREYAHAVSYSMPIEETLNAFVPEFSGILGNYWGRNGIHFHSEYAGVVVLVLAGAGMFAAGNRRGFRWFWIGTFAVSLFWAFGGYTPFYRLIYEVVPYTKYLRAPSTMMFLSMFSVSVLAALGAERVLGGVQALSRKFFVGWSVAAAALVVLIVAGLGTNVANIVGADLARFSPEQASSVIAFKVDQAEQNQGRAVLGALRALLTTGVILGLLWALQGRRLAARHAAYAMATLVAFDLWITERQYWIFSPRGRVLFASDPAIDSLKASPDLGRVMTWTPRFAPGEPRDPYLGTGSGTGADYPYNGLMVHRQRLIFGNHGNELGRYRQLIDVETSRSRIGLPLSPAFMRHENVRYLYTTAADSVLAQVQAVMQWSTPARIVAGPVRNAAGSTVYLYRLPGDNPPAWVASAMVKGTDDQALGTILDERFEPTRAAILDTGSTVQVPPLTAMPAPSGVQARVTRYAPGSIDVSLDKPAAAGTALVVSENFYPGWSSTADGQQARVERANYNLIGVVLPAGSRQVQLRFRDADYESGKTITLIALSLAVVSIAVGVFIDRRRTPLPA